jgi:hypothetical protein
MEDILNTMKSLGGLVVVFVPVIVMVIEYFKGMVGAKGLQAQLLASGISVLFGILFVVAYLWPESALWIGVVMFLVVMGVAPSGGFKLLERFAGINVANAVPDLEEG